jgi:phosphatidylglycerophosphate synthase
MPGSWSSYSALEQRFLPAGRRLVAWLLAPLVGALARRRVSPDAVSAAQIGVGALTALTARRRPRLTLGLAGLAVLLDGLDGSLARATGRASRRGAWLDQLCDHARELTVVTVLARAAGLPYRWPVLYAVLYPASNAALAAASYSGRPVPVAVKPALSLYPAWVWFLWRGERRWLGPCFALTHLLLAATIVQAGWCLARGRRSR